MSRLIIFSNKKVDYYNQKPICIGRNFKDNFKVAWKMKSEMRFSHTLIVWFKLVSYFGKQHDKASHQSLNGSTQEFHFGVLAKENNTKSGSVVYAKMFHISLFIMSKPGESLNDNNCHSQIMHSLNTWQILQVWKLSSERKNYLLLVTEQEVVKPTFKPNF